MVLVVLGVLVTAFFALDLDRYLSLDYVKERQAAFEAFYARHRFLTLTVYMLVYVLVTALSLPGAAVMTLAGGALFGLVTGTVVVSFASTIGATLAFLVARFLLRDMVERRFGQKLQVVNDGLAREGAFYLFSLRLIPIFPFFMINLLMGLTQFRTTTFFWVSQLGMLPGTIVYVLAGTQLGQIRSTEDIFSPGLIVSFVILGLFPLITKKIMIWLKKRRQMKRFPVPRRVDYNMVVIGAGSGGLVASYIAAAVKARVALIERERMGGDCLNTGCVPSKALIRSAKMLSYARRATEFGFRSGHFDFDFAQVMARVRQVIGKIAPHDSVERYTQLGVECIRGEGRIVSPYAVEVNGRTLTTRSIVVATGARPIVPDIPGLEDVPFYTSDTVWNLRELPRRLLVLGGGPIGCELAQCFQRFGAAVTLVQAGPQLLDREDPEVGEFVCQRFVQEGIDVLLNHRATAFERDGEGFAAVCRTQAGTEVRLAFDAVLLALGRRANVTGFGLEELGVAISPAGTVEADVFLRTNIPSIYVCGDVAGPFQFTHTAAHQAWYAAVNALFSPFKQFRADYRVVPAATFTDPEVARVGLNETQARKQGVAYEVTHYGLDDLDRAIADGEDHGFVKVLTPPGKDRILGATIVGYHASEYIVEFVAAMKHGFGLNKILGTIHIYPTLAEANKYVAGNWKKAHAPQTLLEYVARFHRWRRGEGQARSGAASSENC